MIRVAITARGLVQGVGFRPFVDRTARSLGLAGWVRNERDAVRIEAQGAAPAVHAFVDALTRAAPAPARVDGLDVVAIAPLARGEGEAFEIRHSTLVGRVAAMLPADLAVCDDCARETTSPGSRRYRYSFTNCSACGPRFSIVESLPYDRARTSMRAFPMCAACAAEYADPRDRRYHAEPIACPACGPEVVLRDSAGAENARGDAAVHAAVGVLRAGEILALLGIGGFQFLVDATDERAVARLRERKRRPRKPFAVMFPDDEVLRRHAFVKPAEIALIRSRRTPIVLVHAAGEPLAPSVAPHSRWVGAMLPYSPLHRLLLEEIGRPLVCTSGNLAEEPLCVDMADAFARLGDVADAWLVHDRRVARPLDDSLARVDGGGVTRLLRRARGYAPEHLRLSRDGPTVLALGGDGKATTTLAIRDTAVVGPHVGDLASPDGIAALERSARDLARFLDARIERVACDLHPDYASTRLAERLAMELGAPLVRVQHHHAHVAACVAEHGIVGPVLGLAWDGAGLGDDGAVWGGEALICEGATFERVAHLRPFALPGGDRAARSPRRIALALAVDALGADGALELAGHWFPAARRDAEILVRMIERGVRAPMTTSVGRLFDAVACVAGLLDEATFESEAGIAVEQAAERWLAGGETVEPWPLPLERGRPAVADTRELVRAALADRAGGLTADAIAMKLHETLAEFAAAIAERVGVPRVVVTGGCFQNGVLLSRVSARLRHDGFEVFTPERFPPNDGGLSLGQAWIAREMHDVLGGTR